eukprot:TRINITY_DN46108_c0_g1_i1.p2 TRINITY_DN46108_c0_g1~~TRINITY_DN46108_c0_g1_i1.p2  ORF type:complete len:200 (+),score=42.42 TRINITY_DN46108_c0_g1_i1:86-601(+)
MASALLFGALLAAVGSAFRLDRENFQGFPGYRGFQPVPESERRAPVNPVPAAQRAKMNAPEVDVFDQLVPFLPGATGVIGGLAYVYSKNREASSVAVEGKGEKAAVRPRGSQREGWFLVLMGAIALSEAAGLLDGSMFGLMATISGVVGVALFNLLRLLRFTKGQAAKKVC